MGSSPRPFRALLACAALGLCPACGAGLITGIAANENSGSAEARPPGLSLNTVLPLVSAAGTQRTVIVTNAQIPASAVVRVKIEALGKEVDQGSPTVSGQGGSTAITFVLETGPIVTAFGDPTLGDVDGLLTVLVDDLPIAGSVPIDLVRQPRAELGPAQALFLSPFGEFATLTITGLYEEFDPGNIEMFVSTSEPATNGTLIRPCTGVSATATGVGQATVSATVPGNAFPDRAELFIRDPDSGESTHVDVYYRPEITLALPSQGLTTGGNLVTLIGTALVPFDFSQSPAVLSFDAVELLFEKGGRIVTLPREDIREELSAGDRLVFRMPASPDGRPGTVKIVLRVQLDGVTANAEDEQVFLFANPDPFFGPRGAVLDQFPVSVVPIALDAAPSGDDAPDFAVLTEEAGAGFLQLLLAQENGMFLKFGARRRIGDPEVAAERNPADLCTADFDGDQVPDLFVVNAGEATAVHHVVLGQAKPATPLGAVHRVGGAGGMARCRTGFFDGDALEDVLLIPGPAASPTEKPQVLLSRPVFNPLTEATEPGFAQPIEVPVGAMAFQAVEVADLDGDGNLDVAVVDGAQLLLDVAYGRGDGTFENLAAPFQFPIPTTPTPYVPEAGSPAIGLHACGDGPLQSLAVVVAGDDDGNGPDPDPAVATLKQASLRQFSPPGPANVQGLGPAPVGVSLVADLDDSANPVALEMVVAIRGVLPPMSLLPSSALLRFDGDKFEGLTGGAQIGDEQPRNFRALHFERAFPAPGEAKAVFAVHESQIDGMPERRLSTLLVLGADEELTLLSPDAGVQNTPTPKGIVGGNWSNTAVTGEGRVRDLAIARDDGVDVLVNDGFGGLPPDDYEVNAQGIVPRSLSLAPAPVGQVEALVFFDGSSRLAYWIPRDGQTDPDAWSGELRLVSPTPALQTAAVTDGTRVEIVDADGDGIDDVVALLKFNVPTPGEGDALLVLARGKATYAPNELPYHEPTTLTPVHGKATSFALGDFAAVPESSGLPRRLEVALAVPEATLSGGIDGDHVRFYQYVAGTTPAGDHFARSHVSPGPRVLLAGSKPTRVAAADFDRDGLIDLLVAAAGDSSLRLYRNVALPTGVQSPVDIGAFQESLSSPLALMPGFPTELQLGDVNGDGAIDAIAAVESTAVGPLSTAVGFYLSTEPGVFAEAQLVSPTRLGNFDQAMTLDLGDWNRDGVLDLFLGWNKTGVRNVRVLFGGSR